MLIIAIIAVIISFLSGFSLGKWTYSPEKPKKNEIDGFSIEHYPLSGMYFPKYRAHYLKERYPSGLICIESDYLFAKSFATQKAAEAFIERAKEHLFNKGVQTIKYIK